MTPPLTLNCEADLLKTRGAQDWATKAGLEKARWKGLVWNLSFFDKTSSLAEIVNEDDLSQKRYYIVDIDGDVTPCVYGADVVETLVQKAGLKLTKDNVSDYLSFYLGFTRGQAGRVLVIQNVDDLILREELTLITRRNLQALITPFHVQSETKVEGCFLIADKLFKALASIDAHGSVMLQPLEILADTLPVQDQALSA